MAGTQVRMEGQAHDYARFSTSVHERMRSSARRRLVLLLIFGSALSIAYAVGLEVPALLLPVFAVWLIAAFLVERRFHGMRDAAQLERDQTAALIFDIVLVTIACAGLRSALWLGPMAYAFTLVGAGATLPARRAIPLGGLAALAYAGIVLREAGSDPASGWSFMPAGMDGSGVHIAVVSLTGIVMLLLLVHLQRGLIQAVQNGEERLGQLLTTASDMIFNLDRAGFIVEANDAASVAIGVEESRLRGQRFAHLLHPEDSVRFEDALRTAGEGKSSRWQIRVLSATGSLLQLSCAASPIRRGSRVSGLLVVARDVTERLAAERRLAAQHAVSRVLTTSGSVEECWLELLAELADTLGFDVGVLWRHDPATGVLQRDRQWVQYREDPASSNSGRDRQPSPRDTLARGEGVAGRALESGRAEVSEGPSSCVFAFLIQYRHTTLAVVELASTRPGIHAGDLPPLGELLGRQLGEALERDRLNTELLHAEKVRAIGQLVSGVAHELNNPLTAILGFSEQLQDGTRSEEDREALAMILQQSRRARAIVRDLLTYVRKDDRGERSRIETAPFLQRVARTLSRMAEEYECTLKLELPADLPALHVDAPGLEQVLTNLVLNAAQASGRGGEVTMRARSSRSATADGAEMCEILVEDSGPGIPPQHFRQLFEPFFTTKGTGEGTGLGLPVSLGIVQRLGGTITAENRPAAEGGGARFIVRLPGSGERPELEEASAAPQPRPARAASPARAVVSASGVPSAAAGEDRPRHAAPGLAEPVERSVLVIDDEEVIRSALRRYLQKRGWRVTEAADGAIALEILERAEDDAFSAVICDLRMPALDGIALHARLLETRPRLLERFIFSTGDVVSPGAAAFVRSTRCAVVEKPFELATLEATLEQVAQPAAGSAITG